jgi:hypothetical protein
VDLREGGRPQLERGDLGVASPPSGFSGGFASGPKDETPGRLTRLALRELFSRPARTGAFGAEGPLGEGGARRPPARKG